MKALTLHQPFASLAAIGAKTVETRPYATPYRGDLAIHASKQPAAVTDPYYRSLLTEAGFDTDDLPTGAILAVCRLVHCERITPANCPCYPQYAFSDFRPGWYAFHFADIRPLARPVPISGRRGVWTVPASTGLVP